MNRVDLSKIKEANCGTNSFIECEEFLYEGHFSLGDNVRISAKKVYLGNNAVIESDVTVRAIKGVMDRFQLGDETFIGHSTQILVPEFEMLDYSRIYSSILCNGYKPVSIGYNCWFGQSTILNSTENLDIGNNVRMGVNSQVWTHVASGELLEGCRFFSEKPVHIEDNVWLVGSGVTISPGVRLARNTIVMPGSVVSKSTEAFHTYSGIPAADITDKLNGWDSPTQDEKFEKLKSFAKEFIRNHSQYSENVFCFDSDDIQSEILNSNTCSLIFLKEVSDFQKFDACIHSVFDLKSKNYIKRRTDIEIDWMKFAVGYRARFIPINVNNFVD